MDEIHMQHFISEIMQKLSDFGNMSARRMFGGYGIYKDGIIIALADDKELYFKSVPTSQSYYQSFGSTPFIYEGQLRPIQLSYWKVPADVINNPETLGKWVETAFQSSKEYQAKKPPKRTKRIV